MGNKEIDLKVLKEFLMSRDLDRYDQEKEFFFGNKHAVFV